MLFRVEGMTCGGCEKSVTRIITSLDRDARVETDLASGTVKVETTAPADAVRRKLDEAGFPATRQ